MGGAIPIDIKARIWGFRTILALVSLGAPLAVLAGPPISPGDLALRHDIQLLADYRVVKGTVTTWPMDWDSVAADIRNLEDRDSLPGAARAALARVEARIDRHTASYRTHLRAAAMGAEKPAAIRGFQNTPREEAQLDAGISWYGDWLNLDLNVQGVDDPADGEDVRPDGSEIGLELGNWTFAASTMERWWGPGWDGSLILSNNARPIPSLTLRRNVTKPFQTKWLSWLGPWDLRILWGRMESDRVVPNPRFFGMKFAFRPHPSLEIGLSRTAQWCGEGRPCDFDTFMDLFLGKDNVGDAGITPENEPGNQLAGVDIRWSNTWFGTPMAFYAQGIAEDEAGGFPSRYMFMGGLEMSGASADAGWSWRTFAEVAGTSCDFLKEDRFNCAYNHGIYQTGYRYRGRAVGHGTDNDALVGSLGLVLVTESSRELRLLVRSGELNRGGAPDPRNTLTATPVDLLSADLAFATWWGNSRIEIGVGYEELDDAVSGIVNDEVRGYLQWRWNP